VHAAERAMGLPGSLRASFAGTAKAFESSLRSEPWLLLAALAAVYLVLGMLYESLVHPLTILATLPPAALGALLALRAFHLELTVIALIGLILLVGIVMKNGILIVDFAQQARRERGLSAEAAVREACVIRLRPILMTTLAALFGALPLALPHGAGSELRVPLGLTIVGGLAFAQILGLFTTPVIYLALDRLGGGRPAPAARSA
jgi:multidrug efflux pump